MTLQNAIDLLQGLGIIFVAIGLIFTNLTIRKMR